MGEEPKTYILATVKDFLQIPADRRAVAVAEFGEWLRIHEALAPLIEAGFVQPPDVMEGVDDNLGENRITFGDSDGKVLGNLTMPITPDRSA